MLDALTGPAGVVILVVAWIALQTFILPRIGIRT